jgi:hypothetical protein
MNTCASLTETHPSKMERTPTPVSIARFMVRLLIPGDTYILSCVSRRRRAKNMPKSRIFSKLNIRI